MKRTNYHGQVFSGICIVSAIAGCGGSSDSLDSSQLRKHPISIKQPSVKSVNSELDCEIQAGYGIADCHIGMLADDVAGEWSIDNQSRDELRVNVRRGIEFIARDKKVSEIFFYVRAQGDSAAYPCGTDRGIFRANTKDDLRAAYGDPSYIGRGEYFDDDGSPRPVEEFVMYAELGIEFRFVGGELNLIGVFVPNKDFDYDQFQQQMGDWIVYIRAPENRPSRIPSPANQQK